jgi:hypothetical protein
MEVETDKANVKPALFHSRAKCPRVTATLRSIITNRKSKLVWFQFAPCPIRLADLADKARPAISGKGVVKSGQDGQRRMRNPASEHRLRSDVPAQISPLSRSTRQVSLGSSEPRNRGGCQAKPL